MWAGSAEVNQSRRQSALNVAQAASRSSAAAPIWKKPPATRVIEPPGAATTSGSGVGEGWGVAVAVAVGGGVAVGGAVGDGWMAAVGAPVGAPVGGSKVKTGVGGASPAVDGTAEGSASGEVGDATGAASVAPAASAATLASAVAPHGSSVACISTANVAMAAPTSSRVQPAAKSSMKRATKRGNTAGPRRLATAAMRSVGMGLPYACETGPWVCVTGDLSKKVRAGTAVAPARSSITTELPLRGNYQYSEATAC